MGQSGGTLISSIFGAVALLRDSGGSSQASGAVTAPAAGAAIASLVIPAGTRWEVTATVNYGATGDVANNMQFEVAGVVQCAVPVQGVANGVPDSITFLVAGGQTVSINAIAAGAAGCVYNAVIVARKVA